MRLGSDCLTVRNDIADLRSTVFRLLIEKLIRVSEDFFIRTLPCLEWIAGDATRQELSYQAGFVESAEV